MGTMRELVAGLGARERVLLGGYAMYLAFGYISFESPTALSAASSSAASVASLFIIAVIATRVVVYGAVVAASRRRCVGSVSYCIGAAAVGAVGFAILGIFASVSGFAESGAVVGWLAACGAALGCGGALLGILWLQFAAAFSLRSVYAFAMASNLASLALYFVATLLPAAAHVPVCFALYMASVVCVWRCLRSRSEEVEKAQEEGFAAALKSLWRPIVSTAVLAFMSGFMFQVAVWHPIPLNEFQGTSIVTQFIVVLALSLPLVFVKRDLAIGSLYKTALPLSAAGFLLLPLIWNVGGIANACAQLGSLVAGILLWCMVADAARSHHAPSASLYAAAMACTSSAQLAGALFGYVRAEALVPGDVTLTAAALIALYAVFMLSTFLFRESRFRDDEKREDSKGEVSAAASASVAVNAMDAAALHRDRCAAIAQRYRFTPREQEVLELLSRGKTNASIARELVVSENTVKFHVKGIYQKLDVHSKAEVVELVENE